MLRISQVIQKEPYWAVVAEEAPLKSPTIRSKTMEEALIRIVKDSFEEFCYQMPKMPKEIIVNVLGSNDPLYLSEYIPSNLPLKIEDKQRIFGGGRCFVKASAAIGPGDGKRK